MDTFTPTPLSVIRGVLAAVGLLPGERFVDLGSGDGRVVREALQTFGANAYGVEIDAELVRKSNSYRVPSHTKNADLRLESLSGADVATLFCEEPIAEVLATAKRDMKAGARLVLIGEHEGLEFFDVDGYAFSIWRPS